LNRVAAERDELSGRWIESSRRGDADRRCRCWVRGGPRRCGRRGLGATGGARCRWQAHGKRN